MGLTAARVLFPMPSRQVNVGAWSRVSMVVALVVLAHGALWGLWPETERPPMTVPSPSWVSVQVGVLASPMPSTPSPVQVGSPSAKAPALEEPTHSSPQVQRRTAVQPPVPAKPQPSVPDLKTTATLVGDAKAVQTPMEPARANPRPAPAPAGASPASQPEAPASAIASATSGPSARPGAKGHATERSERVAQPPLGAAAPLAAAALQPKLSNPEPSYPRLSLRLGEQGLVRLRAHVNSQGVVDAVELLDSSGFARLDQAAMQAVQGWAYDLPNGQVMAPQWLIVPVTFALQAR